MGIVSAPLFHLAIPVNDLKKARYFYKEVLGASEGRSDDRWADFNFFGHQLVLHLDDSQAPLPVTNLVDGDIVPVPHFGLIVDQIGWEKLLGRLDRMQWPLDLAPHIKFKNTPGEQWTMFLSDPSGNTLEFKFFENPDKIFATE